MRSDPVADHTRSRRYRITWRACYSILSGGVVVSAVLVLGRWLASFPDTAVAAAQLVVVLALIVLAGLAADPVLHAVLRRWPGLVGGCRDVLAHYEFAVDVDGETLTYQIVEGPGLERLKSWCAVHGLEPERVVVPQTATIRDGYLSLELYEVNAEGRHYVDPRDDTMAARTSASVRLMDNPPDCWIRREESRHAA